MHDDRGRAHRRPLDPEGAEVRKLLALRIGGIEREPARREAVSQTFRDRAEIARAEKHADLVEIVRPVDRPVNAEARKAEILHVRRGLVAEGEHFGRIDDRRCEPVLHLENVDAVGVVEAAMKELELERQFVGAPERMIRQEADHAVTVVGQVLQRRREACCPAACRAFAQDRAQARARSRLRTARPCPARSAGAISASDTARPINGSARPPARRSRRRKGLPSERYRAFWGSNDAAGGSRPHHSPLQRSTETTPKEFQPGRQCQSGRIRAKLWACCAWPPAPATPRRLCPLDTGLPQQPNSPETEERPDADYRFPGPCL